MSQTGISINISLLYWISSQVRCGCWCKAAGRVLKIITPLEVFSVAARPGVGFFFNESVLQNVLRTSKQLKNISRFAFLFNQNLICLHKQNWFLKRTGLISSCAAAKTQRISSFLMRPPVVQVQRLSASDGNQRSPLLYTFFCCFWLQSEVEAGLPSLESASSWQSCQLEERIPTGTQST